MTEYREATGQVPGPGEGAGPGQVPAPGPGEAPGQSAAPGEDAGPGQVPAPGPGEAPGQSAAPGEGAGPGQVAARLLGLIREAIAAHSPTYHEAPAVGVFERAATSLPFGRPPRFFDHGIATVVCGPGNLAFAHTAEEHIELSQIAEGVRFYTELLRIACGVRQRGAETEFDNGAPLRKAGQFRRHRE